MNLLVLNYWVPYIAGNLTDLLTVPLDVAAENTDIDLSSLSSNISSILYIFWIPSYAIYYKSNVYNAIPNALVYFY